MNPALPKTPILRLKAEIDLMEAKPPSSLRLKFGIRRKGRAG